MATTRTLMIRAKTTDGQPAIGIPFDFFVLGNYPSAGHTNGNGELPLTVYPGNGELICADALFRDAGTDPNHADQQGQVWKQYLTVGATDLEVAVTLIPFAG